jgi:DNA adenine methylase
MKACFAYYGGKSGMAPLIVSLLPPHRVYMEPFAGSLAVLFAKEPSQHEIVNDLDGAVVAFFRMLRDRPDDLERACRLTPYARLEYQIADLSASGLSDLELARRFWVRVNQSFAKSHGGRTGWSVTTARNQSTTNSVLGRLDRFQACAERLMSVVIESYDASELIDRLATPDTSIYADPPYLGSGRSGSRQTGGYTDYAQDMSDPQSHERLAEALHRTPAAVILSGYPTPLYETLYGDWDYLDISVHVHSSNAVAVERGERTERLWSNRPLQTSAQQAMDLWAEEAESL